MVLAGGRARRLGGFDKPGLRVGGVTLLDGVLAACAGAAPIVVVGPRRATRTAVRWAREEPPQGGPLAALAAGLGVVPPEVPITRSAGTSCDHATLVDTPGDLAACPPQVMALLAADLPNLRSGTLQRLHAALDGRADGAVLVDEEGRPQWLCGMWRTAALRAAVDAVPEPAGRPLRAVLGALTVVEVPAEGDEAFDVDTADDLRALRSRPSVG